MMEVEQVTFKQQVNRQYWFFFLFKNNVFHLILLGTDQGYRSFERCLNTNKQTNTINKNKIGDHR